MSLLEKDKQVPVNHLEIQVPQSLLIQKALPLSEKSLVEACVLIRGETYSYSRGKCYSNY